MKMEDQKKKNPEARMAALKQIYSCRPGLDEAFSWRIKPARYISYFNSVL